LQYRYCGCYVIDIAALRVANGKAQLMESC
jgi:hypothetical protein